MDSNAKEVPALLEMIQAGTMTIETGLELVTRLQQLDKPQEAYTALLLMVEKTPDSIPALMHLAKQAYLLGKHENSCEYYRRVIKLRPDKFPDIYPRLVRALLSAGHHADALDYCEKALTINPTQRFALAFKYIALANLGDMNNAQAIINPEEYVKRVKPECPPGFDSIADFNAYLINHIQHNTKLNRDPPQYSTHGGWQSEFRKLFENNVALGRTMLDFIGKAQDKYLRLIPADYIRQSAWEGFGKKSRSIEVWAVVLEQQGAQDPHIHPSSWLSGAYYLEVPDTGDSSNPHAGKFVVGRGPDFLHTAAEPAPYKIRPEEGTFSIFPSYYWHSTIPVASSTKRICIAFDWLM